MKIILYICIVLIVLLGIGLFTLGPYILFKQFQYRKSENKKAELALTYRGVEKYISWGMLVISTICFGIGIFSFVDTWRFKKSALPATGKVIELKCRTMNKGGGLEYAPVVIFIDKTGNSITFESKTYRPAGKYTVGNTIQILYSENDSTKARVNDFYTLWSLIILYFVMVIVGLIGWYVARFFPRKY